MGGGSSHHHHYHTDKESQKAAAKAQAAAAAARERAEALQESMREQQRANERLFAEQKQAQQRAAQEAARAQAKLQRQIDDAKKTQQKEAAEAAKRLQEQREASARAEEQAREQAIAAARRLEEEQRRRATEATEAAKRLEEERVAAELRVQQELQQERVRAHAAKLEEWRSWNRECPVSDFLEDYITAVNEDSEEDAAQDRKVNIGIVGNSGTGKSSLIRAILDRFNSSNEDGNAPRPLSCPEGDGTCSPAPYELGEFDSSATIWDLPGQGTARFPAKTYLCNMGLKYFDAVLVITDGRWSENDQSLLQAIQFATIWHRVVRTKVDLAVESGPYDFPGESQECTLARVCQTLSTQLNITDPNRLHLVTTRQQYWVGVNGCPKFGSIGDLCEQVVSHVESVHRGVVDGETFPESEMSGWSAVSPH
eukprot:TRINITY_DN11174_c0_g2_i1.p1 TRINITY_DN11174_c0_g2~~TRINITY_DN11174_c0_g2_i1.p1  ORF type:complete len:425 (+),score=75.71 TRINITY_DN11174_c0_g2_i1:87-1361(+)